MSDMEKWMELMKSLLKDRESPTVKIDREQGGGVGDVRSVDDEMGTVEVGLMGDPSDSMDVPVDSIAPAIDPKIAHDLIGHSKQHYDEIERGEHYLDDKPELQAGEMVRVNNMYGAGTGEGYGVFVAYSLSGDTAIVNIDGRDTSVPIESVTIAPEEMLDTFSKEVNDGSLSPLSFGDDNKTEIGHGGDEDMDDLERFLKIVHEAETDDLSEEKDEDKKDGDDCDCGNYDCKTCFPDKVDEGCDDMTEEDEDLEEVAVIGDSGAEELDEVQELDELAPVIAALATGAGAELAKKAMGGGSDMGGADAGGMSEEPLDPAMDAEDGLGDELPADDMEIDMGAGQNDAVEDPGQLIADIMHHQDNGLSASVRMYDTDALQSLPLDNLKNIHAKVIGAEMEEDAELAGLREATMQDVPTINNPLTPDEEFEKWMDIINKNS